MYSLFSLYAGFLKNLVDIKVAYAGSLSLWGKFQRGPGDPHCHILEELYEPGSYLEVYGAGHTNTTSDALSSVLDMTPLLGGCWPNNKASELSSGERIASLLLLFLGFFPGLAQVTFKRRYNCHLIFTRVVKFQLKSLRLCPLW